MSIEKTLFYIFAFITLFSGVMVITLSNMVRAILFLVLAFVSSAGLWLLLQAEFLAIILVLVYVGAVMVLFLFVVMMLNIEAAPKDEGFTRYLPVGLAVAITFVALLIWLVGPQRFGLEAYGTMFYAPSQYSNIKTLGRVLYTDYLIAFEMAALLLLVAMVAALGITFRGPKQRKSQQISEQLKANKANRLRIVNLDKHTVKNSQG